MLCAVVSGGGGFDTRDSCDRAVAACTESLSSSVARIIWFTACNDVVCAHTHTSKDDAMERFGFASSSRSGRQGLLSPSPSQHKKSVGANGDSGGDRGQTESLQRSGVSLTAVGRKDSIRPIFSAPRHVIERKKLRIHLYQ